MRPTKEPVWDRASHGEQRERRSEVGPEPCAVITVCWENLHDFIPSLEMELFMLSLSSKQLLVISAVYKTLLIYYIYMMICLIQMIAGSVTPTHISPKPFTLKIFQRDAYTLPRKLAGEALCSLAITRGQGLTPDAPWFQSCQSLKSQDLPSAPGTPEDPAVCSHTRLFQNCARDFLALLFL